MTISYLGHKFQVNSVPFLDDIETRLNIKKRRERVVYRTLSSQDNINIAYLIGQEITPGNNFFISDKSTRLTQNRTPRTQDMITTTTKTLSLNVPKFLVTDVFTTETATAPATPLFYEHTLEFYNSDLSDFSNRTLLSIEFADHTLKPIEFSEYVLETSTGKLRNNIENEYDDMNQSFTITMVKYTVRTGSGATQTVTLHHELINNLPVFTQADFDDVDVYGNILTGLKKYIVEEQPGGLFLVTLPITAKYAYKETVGSRLRILPPTAIDLSVPWNVRVTNGEFITSLQKTSASFVNHKYYIAEFDSQVFQPYPPYKLQPEQKATWLYDNLAHIPKHIALSNILDLQMQIVVKDSSNVLKYIYSTDTTKIGTLYQDSIRYTDGILSVDKLNGFIELLDPIRDDDEILVSYFAEEEEYEFTSIDFNPVNNLNILNQRIVIYINPETVSTGELDKSVYYLIVDSLGKITYASQPAESTTSLDPATQKMLSEDFFSSGAPIDTFYYDQESTQSGLASRVSGVNTAYKNEFSFIDKYTVDSVLLTSTIASGYAVSKNYEDNPRYLVLADIYVGEDEAPDGLSQFDVRIQGGGIKDEYREAALAENSEAAWYWDFNAKRPYPGVGAFMAEIPQTLLTAHGGTFTREQIVDVMERHMKMGGYGIVNTYGIDPSITTVTTTSGNITLAWPSYGSSVSYGIYFSNTIDTGFILVNSGLQADTSSGNTYTISGLIPSTKYFVKIGATDINEDESFGTVISATTTTSVV